MSKWSKFYEKRLNEKYRNHISNRYGLVLEEMLKTKSKNFAQFGCGMGNMSRLVSEILPNSNHILLDNDVDMLSLAEKNMNEVDFFGKKMIIHHDILDELLLTNIDLIHSHGVLEHFSDLQIQTIIKNQLKVTKKLIHYVPSWKYEVPSYGDERLLTKEDWKRICNPDQIIEFNNGYDLILIWR